MHRLHENRGPRKKELDDRSKVLVHLGTEPGSKAYRLLDPKTKRITVSRDVIFDEEKEWNWDEKNETEQPKSGEFIVDLKRLDNGSVEQENMQGEDEGEGDTEGNDEEHIVVDEEDDDHQDLRRSTRERTMPTYLDDYVLLAEVESEKLLMMVMRNHGTTMKLRN